MGFGAIYTILVGEAYTALVRQRSRVKIPAKAHSFGQKERESAFSSLSSVNTTLPNTVRSLQYIVRPPRQRSTRLSYQDTNDNSIDDDDKFWVKFQEYLLTIQNRHTAKSRLLYL